MNEILDVAVAVSMPLKAAWLVLAVWIAVQIVWWRRGHVVVLPPMAPTPRRSRPKHDAGHHEHGAPV